MVRLGVEVRRDRDHEGLQARRADLRRNKAEELRQPNLCFINAVGHWWTVCGTWTFKAAQRHRSGDVSGVVKSGEKVEAQATTERELERIEVANKRVSVQLPPSSINNDDGDVRL